MLFSGSVVLMLTQGQPDFHLCTIVVLMTAVSSSIAKIDDNIEMFYESGCRVSDTQQLQIGRPLTFRY